LIIANKREHETVFPSLTDPTVSAVSALSSVTSFSFTFETAYSIFSDLQSLFVSHFQCTECRHITMSQTRSAYHFLAKKHNNGAVNKYSCNVTIASNSKEIAAMDAVIKLKTKTTDRKKYAKLSKSDHLSLIPYDISKKRY